eukprot:TRINITY_DN5174_c0_g1_i2.p1 TRINITY_DN5174_c0_g1~~TRINITY_DN5174_c0_g1_i2.p1  ORF type:complete len:942 (+),score=201.24 TRINITY_DN5174_c0_g1_i2:46-2871(+)
MRCAVLWWSRGQAGLLLPAYEEPCLVMWQCWPSAAAFSVLLHHLVRPGAVAQLIEDTSTTTQAISVVFRPSLLQDDTSTTSTTSTTTFVEETTQAPEVAKTFRLDGVALAASLGSSLVCSACVVLVIWRVCCAAKSGRGTARQTHTEPPLMSVAPTGRSSKGSSVSAQVLPAAAVESPHPKEEDDLQHIAAPEPLGQQAGGEGHQQFSENPMEDPRIEELNLAIEAQDIERLDLALTGARQVSTHAFTRLLERLLERGEQLLADLRRKENLEASMRQAVQRRNKAELEKSLPAARLVHEFPPELLDRAERVLSDLKAEAAHNARQGVEMALRAAIIEGDLESLEKLLVEAVESGVGQDVVLAASEHIEKLQAEAAHNARQGVEMALRAAIIEGDLESLEKLLVEAVESGVGQDVVLAASEHIEKLQAKRDLERAMREAMEAGDLDRLIDLLSRSLEVAVSIDVIEQAEAVIETLKRMREIEADLRAALMDQDSERIHAQLQAARQAKLSCQLIEEAEEVLEQLLDIQIQVRSAIKARNLAALQRSLIPIRATGAFASLLVEARQAEITLLEEVLEEELRSALDCGSDLVLLCELVIRAEAFQFMRLQSSALREAAELLSKHFTRRSVEVNWNATSRARPWRAKGIDWELNPIVQVSVCEGESQGGVHRVHAFLEDLDSQNADALSADQKYGFAVTSNPSSMSHCTALVPGGPVLAEAELGDNFIAKSAFDLQCSDKKLFLESGAEAARTAYAIASLKDDVQRGGRARFHFWSEVELRVEALPSLGERWEAVQVLDAEWQPCEEEPGRPQDNAAAWLASNPVFEISFSHPGRAVLVAVLLPLRECKAKLHILKLKDGHMHLTPNSFDVIAQGENSHSACQKEIAVHAELDEDDAMLGPFFVVPSLDSASTQAETFQLQLRGPQMEVARVSSSSLRDDGLVLE